MQKSGKVVQKCAKIVQKCEKNSLFLIVSKEPKPGRLIVLVVCDVQVVGACPHDLPSLLINSLINNFIN